MHKHVRDSDFLVTLKAIDFLKIGPGVCIFVFKNVHYPLKNGHHLLRLLWIHNGNLPFPCESCATCYSVLNTPVTSETIARKYRTQSSSHYECPDVPENPHEVKPAQINE